MVDNSIGIITPLVSYVGYEGATKLAKEVMSSNKTVRQVIPKKVFSPKKSWRRY